MTTVFDVAIVGSGFAGSLLARILAVQGYDVALLERGSHPRFAIGESSTPLANLALERIGRRYGLADCYNLATHGRWLEHFPALRRGLKRGFTFYRHHPGQAFDGRGDEAERLLVAASPNDTIADTHWFRADVDEHFVRAAVDAGVSYTDRVELTRADFSGAMVHLAGMRDDAPFSLDARFVIDATGPAGFLARQLAIPSALERVATRSALVFSHFDSARPMAEVLPDMPAGPYPDDWAAVHHIIHEGWLYSLRFDDGVTSAGFLLTPAGVESLASAVQAGPEALWSALVARYPTLRDSLGDARPTRPIAFIPRVQHRLARAADDRWAVLPHAFAFVDPLFSTGIAWTLRAIERLADAFEGAPTGSRIPAPDRLQKYEQLLTAEADQIDRLIAGAYDAMSHFDLFEAQAMIYFATVSYSEVVQRVAPGASPAWTGFLGVGDPVLEPLPRDALRRLLSLGSRSDAAARRAFTDWVAAAIAPRNVAGLCDPGRRHRYPVDLDLLIDRHALLGMTRSQLVDALPALRGMSPAPSFGARTPASAAGRGISPPAPPSPAPGTPAPR